MAMSSAIAAGPIVMPFGILTRISWRVQITIHEESVEAEKGPAWDMPEITVRICYMQC